MFPPISASIARAFSRCPCSRTMTGARSEVFCYSSVERPDAWTRRIESHADAWRDVRELDDDAARPASFARTASMSSSTSTCTWPMAARCSSRCKPAPVQIAWLAYPGTTGIGAIDYRLSDPRLDPEGFEHHYTERTLRLCRTRSGAMTRTRRSSRSMRCPRSGADTSRSGASTTRASSPTARCICGAA